MSRWDAVEIVGVGLIAGGVGLLWLPASAVLVGVYMVAAANVRGR